MKGLHLNAFLCDSFVNFCQAAFYFAVVIVDFGHHTTVVCNVWQQENMRVHIRKWEQESPTRFIELVQFTDDGRTTKESCSSVYTLTCWTTPGLVIATGHEDCADTFWKHTPCFLAQAKEVLVASCCRLTSMLMYVPMCKQTNGCILVAHPSSVNFVNLIKCMADSYLSDVTLLMTAKESDSYGDLAIVDSPRQMRVCMAVATLLQNRHG